MNVHDNFQRFSDLLDKHLYFLPVGFIEGEGYGNIFTRHAQILVIIRMFFVDFHNNKVFKDNETLSKLKSYYSLLLSEGEKFENLMVEKEVIDFLLSLDQLPDLKYNNAN